MMNRLPSPVSATGGAGATPYDVYDLFAELPTEDVEPDVLPDYITEVPLDVRRQEFVGLTVEEQIENLREEERIKGRTLADELSDSVGGLFDRVLLAPMRLLLANVGFLVAGVIVLGAVTYAANWLISALMGNFQGSLF